MTIEKRGRGLVTRWVAPVVVLALVAGVFWVAGGFRAAPADAGPAGRIGEPIDIARWTISVERVALVNSDANGYEQDPRFRVWASITNTSDETQAYLDNRLIEVAVPGGPDTGALMVASDDVRGSQFDPDVPRKVVLEFNWPEREKDQEKVPLLPAPEHVAVIIRDEQPSDGFLTGPGWAIDRPVAVIKFPLDDQRRPQ